MTNQYVRDVQRHLFEGDTGLAMDALEALCSALAEGADLPTVEGTFSVLQGAFWALTDNHGGQWTLAYRMLSQLSRHYSPGALEHQPEEGDSLAWDTYEAVVTEC